MTINAAIDDQTAGDNPRVLTTAGKNFGAQRDLESAGYFEQIDIAAIQFGVSAKKSRAVDPQCRGANMTAQRRFACGTLFR